MATPSLKAEQAVAISCQSYKDMLVHWALPRALMGGTTGMRAAGKEYLPIEPAETDLAYNNRLKRSTLFNAFRKTVKTVVGKVFSKPIVLGEDVPIKIAGTKDSDGKPAKDGWIEDIDLAGRNLDVFAEDVFRDGITTGKSHILTEMPPPLAVGATLQDETDSGRRPYFVHIKAEDLFYWRSEVINGKQTLTQIKFHERLVVEDTAYTEKTEERIRVMWRDRYEVWRKLDSQTKNGPHQYELIEEGPMQLGLIPLATFYAFRTGFMTALPPLEDLAWLNVAHWQSNSDQRHILHVARVPILFGKMLHTDEESGDVVIGPNQMVKSNDPAGELSYVEHGGTAIESGRQDLLDLEDRMRVMGLEMMISEPGNETATGRALDSAEQNASTKAAALALKDALERSFTYMALWANLGPTGGSATVNTDFGISAQGAAEIQNLIDMRMGGLITRETFWAEMKRRGLLMDDFDASAEVRNLAKEVESAGITDDPPEDDDELDDTIAGGGGRGLPN